RQLSLKIQPRTAPVGYLHKRGRLLCLVLTPVQGPGGVPRALYNFCDAAFEKEIPMALPVLFSKS
ncbi:MAG: hypothetical protein JSV50_07465, partial [Desulfobacteraceae bacterium]